MRLLLAEDEKELSKALCAILKHNNYSVDAVFNGQDALDYGLCENYDGIILDLMMPKKNGLEVLSELRKQGIAANICSKLAGGHDSQRVRKNCYQSVEAGVEVSVNPESRISSQEIFSTSSKVQIESVRLDLDAV